MFALFARNIQMQHSYLAENITPYTFGLGLQQLPQALNNETAAMLLSIDAEINRQAATIAYINDFKLMMWIVLAVTPMVYFLKNKSPSTAAE